MKVMLGGVKMHGLSLGDDRMVLLCTWLVNHHCQSADGDQGILQFSLPDAAKRSVSRSRVWHQIVGPTFSGETRPRLSTVSSSPYYNPWYAPYQYLSPSTPKLFFYHPATQIPHSPTVDSSLFTLEVNNLATLSFCPLSLSIMYISLPTPKPMALSSQALHHYSHQVEKDHLLVFVFCFHSREGLQFHLLLHPRNCPVPPTQSHIFKKFSHKQKATLCLLQHAAFNHSFFQLMGSQL